ncbi:unnamed protein product, partial [marine sediment metagenome]
MPKKKTVDSKPTWLKTTLAPNLLERSDYCIFHKPDKTEEESKIFTEKLREKLENKDYDFFGYHFPGQVNFERQVFENSVDFRETTFRGHTNFTA